MHIPYKGRFPERGEAMSEAVARKGHLSLNSSLNT
jgi:hypothetical protein